jgi:hypothetical protein
MDDSYIVKAAHQFGIPLKLSDGFKLFLDDMRNPPRDERGWVVVRNVADGINLLLSHGHLVTTVSLDNDLGPDPQGIELLKWIVASERRHSFPLLTHFIIHTSNLPQGRAMRRLLLGQGFKVTRVDATERVYPRASKDPRVVKPYTTFSRKR